MRRTAWVSALLLAIACGSSETNELADARAVPMSQSAAARALRLPRMRAAQFSTSAALPTPVALTVHVVFSGTLPPDTTVQARSFDAACTESFVDTAVVANGGAVSGVLVWLEGEGVVRGATASAEYRPTVALEQCRFTPRVQLAAPGSTIQLVTHDARVESMVVVPASPSTPIDTVHFNTDGQLVPVTHRADSIGVLGIYATRLPWARAFVAIAAPGAAAITDANGAATFAIEPLSKKLTVRAWHPSLGVVIGSITPSNAGSAPTLTLNFRQ
jgi:hypothetical protein